jgi:hypothetical protein
VNVDDDGRGVGLFRSIEDIRTPEPTYTETLATLDARCPQVAEGAEGRFPLPNGDALSALHEHRASPLLPGPSVAQCCVQLIRRGPKSSAKLVWEPCLLSFPARGPRRTWGGSLSPRRRTKCPYQSRLERMSILPMRMKLPWRLAGLRLECGVMENGE